MTAFERRILFGVELRHLVALDTVARRRSFRGAAVELGYAQSAVSQQIAALERATGCRLIRRSSGRSQVELTEAGSLLLCHAEAILDRLRVASDDLQALRAARPGRLRVGFTESFGLHALSGLIRRFAADCPATRVLPLELSANANVYEGVERGALDVGIADLPAPSGAFESFELPAVPYVLVGAACAPLPPGPLSLDDIAALPLIGRSNCQGLDQLEAHFRAQGVALEISVWVGSHATTVALVGAGIGYAVIPRLSLDPRDTTISAHELPGLAPRTLGIVRRKDREQRAVDGAFVEAARAVCLSMACT